MANATTPVIQINEGNVGIGTFSPLTKLHIAGTTDGNIIRIENTVTSLSLGSTIGAIQFFNNDPTDNSPNVAASIYATAGASGGSGALRFKTTEPGTEGDPATDTMIITNGGNVGIGTTSPEVLLTLSETTNNTSIGFYNTGTNAANRNWVIGSNDQVFGDFAIMTSTAIGGNPISAGVKRLYINAAGNVGIGTTLPTAKLHVAGTGLFTGLVSGITPTANANFVTKAYADALTPGSGVFLPLAGGTMDSGATIGGSGTLELGGTGVTNLLFDSDGTNIMQLVKASASLQYAQIISNDDKVRLRFKNGMDVYYDDTGLIDYMYFQALGSHTTQFKTRNFEIIGIGASNDETFFKAEGGGAVSLYYDNVLQLNTTSTGISTNTIDATVSAGSAGNFVVMDGTRLASRTAAQVLADIGAAPATGGAYLPVNNPTFTGTLTGPTASITGNLTMGGTIFASNNSPAYSFGSDTNTGIARTGTHQMSFLSNNSVSLNLDALARAQFYNAVTINGSTAPFTSSELDVRGDIVLIDQNWALRGNNSNADFCIEELGSSFSDANVKLVVKSGGNVGIGTTSPANKLVVSTSTAGDYAALINNTHSTTGYGLLARTASTGTSAYALAARAGSSDIFVVRADGNVGIGTTSPSSKLEVNGNVTISEKIIHAGDTNTFLKFNSGGWEFQSSGGPTTDISASGGVTSIYGKGTEAIQVGSGQLANFLGPIYATNSLTTALNPIAASGGTKALPAYSFISDTNTGMYSDTADQLEFVTGGDIGMVIDSSSNVGIGNTNPGNKLEVTGIIEATVGNTGGFAYGANPASKQGLMISVSNTGGDGFSGAGRIENTSTTNSSSAVLVLRQTNSASFSTITQYRQGSGTQGSLVGFVRVTTTNTIFSTSGSDERLKKNITNWTDDTLGKFKALQPKKFRYKIQDASEEKTLGFIAQNEVANFPEAYVLNKENEDDDAMYSFNPMGMTTHLMKAIKDLVEKVEILENKITQLENNN